MRSYLEDDLSGVRLVASDMDCTLLADDKSMPEDMPGRIRALEGAGALFAAASGRPLYTLRDMFPDSWDHMAFVTDNGAAVVCREDVVFKSLIEPATVQALTEFTLEGGYGLPTVCGLDACYVREQDRRYDDVFRTFYHNIVYVETLDHLAAEVNKFTVYFPEGNAVPMRDEVYAPAWGERLSVTCGGAVWIDIMNQGVDKGTGVERLCEHLGISVADVVACGDTDNDAEMLETVGHGYLVANAEERRARLLTQMIYDMAHRREITLVNGGSQRRCFTSLELNIAL